MADITVANKDWGILEAVKAALAEARIAGNAVFRTVSVTAGLAQAKRSHLLEPPVAVVRYVGTAERHGPDGERNCQLSLEILLAAMVDAGGVDESARLAEALRLVNAAKNAVEASPPNDSDAVGDDSFYAPRILWGRPGIDEAGNRPWVCATLPVQFGYRLTTATGH